MEHEMRRIQKRRDERGFTLVETMIASAILLIVVSGLLSLFTLAVTTNQQQGNLATRTTEYAQDKMEQLLALSFADGSTNTTVFPITPTGGTGLGGTVTIGAPVGSATAGAPATNYADYLDDTGNLLTGPTGSSYTRQWQISIDSTGTLKTITVLATSQVPGVQQGLPPSTVVVCMKSSGL